MADFENKFIYFVVQRRVILKTIKIFLTQFKLVRVRHIQISYSVISENTYIQFEISLL